MKKILVEFGVRKELMTMFNTTYPTLRLILKYQSKHPLADKIRNAALNKGGVISEKPTN